MDIIAAIIFFIYVIIIFIKIHKLDEKFLKEKIKDELKKTSVIRKRMPLKNKLKEVKCMRRKAKSKTTSKTMTIKHLNRNKTSSGDQIQSQGEESPNKESSSPIRLLKYVSHTQGNNNSYFSPFSSKDEFCNENPRMTSRSDELKLTFESPKDKRLKKVFSIQLHPLKMTTLDNDLNQGVLHSDNDKLPKKAKSLVFFNSLSDTIQCNSKSKSMSIPIVPWRSEREMNTTESCDVSIHLKESVAEIPNLGLIECASPKGKRSIKYTHKQGNKPKPL